MAKIKHVVMMSWKPGTPDATLETLIKQYQSLPQSIPTMKHFEYGAEGGVSERTEGYSHCFISTFENLDDVRAYGPHPAHQAFVKAIEPYLEKILVFDFEAK